ncbi:hypothetical protein ABZ532_00490 [Streptomyces sp. NPDC019396]|uniref:hypothetical protein n=1 Tax=Streptomyces sp. NPDC019396 TaxID=3154687 RepID=UPI0033F823E4
MSPDRPAASPALPPVRLRREAELARDALGAPLLSRAVRLARWAGPGTRVGAGGVLVEDQLPDAAKALGLAPDEEGTADASAAWRVAVDTGLVEVVVPDDEDGAGDGVGGGELPGTVTTGGNLPLITGGSPRDVLALWQDAFESVRADAIAPLLDDLSAVIDEQGEIDLDALNWDPEAESEFLDGVLGNLYLLTLTEGAADGGITGDGAASAGSGAAVPLPALAASMIVPDDMGEPTDDILEQVSEAMMRLDDQFRLLEPIGLVRYRPVDGDLMEEEAGPATARSGPSGPAASDMHAPDAADDDVSRYGLVALTPLGLYGIRARMLEAGIAAPAVGDLATGGADALLDGVARYSELTARAETIEWLARRTPRAAAAELLDAAHGTDRGAPLRRLHCQQALALLGADAEPAVRAVLDDRELGGLARVWLAERGTADVPAPPPSMILWLAVDTIAAQLDAEGESDELRGLVEGLVGQHSGFFGEAWRVEHPATADVLEAMGRLHGDRGTAKEARKAAFKARSRAGT